MQKSVTLIFVNRILQFASLEKGNKMRVVPISPSMSALLKEYMDTVHPIEQRQNR